MRMSICRNVFLAAACMMAQLAVYGQEQQAPTPPAASSLDVAVTYNPTLANIVHSGSDFWMRGGSVQIHGRFWHGLGVVADAAGLYKPHVGPGGVGLDLITATFGPRYTWTPRQRRVSFFGQTLLGEAHGMNSIFPSAEGASSTADSLALQLGGGVNLALTHHLGIRLCEADWLRTQLPNDTTDVQNNLRLGAGFFLSFQ